MTLHSSCYRKNASYLTRSASALLQKGIDLVLSGRCKQTVSRFLGRFSGADSTRNS